MFSFLEPVNMLPYVQVDQFTDSTVEYDWII